MKEINSYNNNADLVCERFKFFTGFVKCSGNDNKFAKFDFTMSNEK